MKIEDNIKRKDSYMNKHFLHLIVCQFFS